MKMFNYRQATWLTLFSLLLTLAIELTVAGQEKVHLSATCKPPSKRVWNSHHTGRGIPPPGYSLHAMRAVQVANGQATRLTLYQFDFIRGTERLSPRGYFQLQKLLQRLPETPYPLTIETTGSTELDKARRAFVLNVLDELNFPLPEERVVVGPPPTRPLDGVDAIPLHQRLLGLSTGASDAAAVVPGAAVPPGAAPPLR